jgi:hypothetical protein
MYALKYVKKGKKRITIVFFRSLQALEQFRSSNKITVFKIENITFEAHREYINR